MMQPTAFQTIIRPTTENHADTPPDCDASCARWDGLAHAHVCPDGLYNDDLPWVDVTAWCSCGVRVGGPVRLDMRKPDKDARKANASGAEFILTFDRHMKAEHGIDINKDEAWLARMTTPLGATAPRVRMRVVERAGLTGIECLNCRRVSFNQGDVTEVYCANCKLFGVLVP